MKKRLFICIAMFLAGMLPLQSAENGAALALPAPATSGGMSLVEALAQRRSSREFTSEPVPAATLSSLLWAAGGINRPDTGLRTAPSARNWQEIDIYVARADGLFLYNASSHTLEGVVDSDIRAATGMQPFVKDAPVVLVYVADYARMRGADEASRVFYSATDTGFISQNVYLFCAANNLATVVLGMVDKRALKEQMKLRSSQHVILSQPVGFPPGGVRIANQASVKDLNDGIYQGEAMGYIDDVRVEITVAAGKITDAVVTQHRENRPKTALTAMPRAIVARQGIEGIDAVTGATVTSRAVLNAARQALDKAR